MFELQLPCQIWVIAQAQSHTSKKIFLVQMPNFLPAGHFKVKILSIGMTVLKKLANQLKPRQENYRRKICLRIHKT